MEDFDYSTLPFNVRDQDLVDAVRTGDYRQVARLVLSREITRSAMISDGKTALCLAASCGQREVVQTLLELNADPRIACRGLNALHYACKHGDEVIAALMCRHASDLVHEKGQKGDTPLHMACIAKHGGCIKTLCESGASVDCENNDNDRPLHVLFYDDNRYDEYNIISSAKTLMKFGASINDKGGNGMTALHYACKRGFYDSVKFLLNNGATINAQDDAGRTPLHMAVELEHKTVACFLLEYGASIYLVDKWKNSVLHVAAENGKVEFARALVDKGASLSEQDSKGRTPLFRAIELEHDLVAHYLLDSGSDPNLFDESKVSPLHTAVRKRHMELIHILVDNGASVNHQDDNGKSPLLVAVECNHVSVACYLLNSGANPNLVDKCMLSPLLAAVEKGCLELTRALVDKGASVNQQNNDGKSPLLEAVISSNMPIACYLLECGADPYLYDNEKQFPLLAAAFKGWTELVRALVNHGALVNQQDNSGRNALIVAVHFEYEPLVHFLLENSADPELIFDHRLSPLHIATESGHIGIISALVSKGTSINKQDALFRHTALHNAAYYGHEAAVQFLLENGAKVDTLDMFADFPIHTAARRGHTSVIQTLVKWGVCVDELNDAKRTPLHLAAEANHIGPVRFLLENGASVNVVDQFEWSPLYMTFAGGCCDLEIVEALVRFGSDVNLVAKHEGSVLKAAITIGCVDAVRLLIAHGADCRNINSVSGESDDEDEDEDEGKDDDEDKNDYEDEVKNDDEDEEKNDDEDNDDDEDFSNALCMAAFKNEAEIVEVLESLFNDQEKTDAVQTAAKKGSFESLKVLVAAGAKFDYVDSYGQSALHHSSKCRSVNCVEFLLSVGAETDKVDNKGKTPLLLAAAAGAAEVVRALLEAGANAHAYDSEGGSALTYACVKKHVPVVRILLEYEAGFDVTCPHNDMNLLRCLYLQYIDDIWMVDTFEEAIIRTCIAKWRDWTLEAFFMENFPSTCHWSSVVEARRKKYGLRCLLELELLRERHVPHVTFLGTLILSRAWTPRQCLDPEAVSVLELKALLQPKQELWDRMNKKYPMYGRLMRTRLQIALKRESLVDSSLEFFDRLGVTVYVARMICEHLTNYDLSAISSIVQNLPKKKQPAKENETPETENNVEMKSENLR